MQKLNLKTIVLLLGFLLPAAWCGASGTNSTDGYSHIAVKESHVQNAPFPSNHEATEHSIIYKPKDDDHSPILPAMWVYGVTHGALNCTGQRPNT